MIQGNHQSSEQPNARDNSENDSGSPRTSQTTGVVHTTLQALLNIIMPPVCLACHTPIASRDAVCPACWQKITFIRPPLCDRLGRPMPFDAGDTMVSAAAIANPPSYRKARAVAQYDGIIRQLIHDFKFRDRHEARSLFGSWLKNAGTELLSEADIIAPVPLNRFRLLTRRFNQSAILAIELSKHSPPTYRPQLLIRSRRTKTQVGLTHAQRKKNVSGAFHVPPSQRKFVEGMKIILVDDVITTGATANACAKALLKAGAKHVDILTLALVTDTAQMTT